MEIKEIHIKNKTLGIGFGVEPKYTQNLYILQFFIKKHAKQIGQDTIENYFTVGMLRYEQRIKVISHKRTHIKQRIT